MQTEEDQAVLVGYGEIPEIVTQLLRQATQPMSAAEITQAALCAKRIEHPTAHQTRQFEACVARFLSRMKKKGNLRECAMMDESCCGRSSRQYRLHRSHSVLGTCDELCRPFPADALVIARSLLRFSISAYPVRLIFIIGISTPGMLVAPRQAGVRCLRRQSWPPGPPARTGCPKAAGPHTGLLDRVVLRGFPRRQRSALEQPTCTRSPVRSSAPPPNHPSVTPVGANLKDAARRLRRWPDGHP